MPRLKGAGSPLLRAVAGGDVEGVDRLLRAGADRAGAGRGRSPQLLAMHHGDLQILRLLQRSAGDEQRLERPLGSGPDTVVLRRSRPRAHWIILALVLAAVGVVVGTWRSSNSAVVVGVILSAVCAATLLVGGLHGLERFAFDGHRFWYRAFRAWQGPIDLRRLRAVYLVPSSAGAMLHLLQEDAGGRIKARRSYGFDADEVARLDSARSLRSVAVTATTSGMHRGCLAEIARYAYASGAVIDPGARRLFDRALADDAARRGADPQS